MGVSDLRDAFNTVTGDAFACTAATMGYTRAHDVEWQVLSFSGTAANGTPFTVSSPQLRPETDLYAATAATARQFMKDHGL